MSDVRFEKLRRGQDRSAFSCGRAVLDDFLRLRAGQYDRRDLAAILEAEALRLPRHQVPVVLLARLAVDVSAQGRGLGRDLLTDALVRAWTLSEAVGVHAVEVHALDDAAARFYRRYGFAALRDDDHHLYLTLATIRSNLADAGGEPVP